MQMIKLIAIDIDGTLINSKMEIPSENYQAIQAAIDQGVKVVLCTGRPTQGSIDETKKLCLCGTDGFLITYHGAVTTKLDTLERISSHTISNDQVVDLFHFAESVGTFGCTITDQSMGTIHRNISNLAKAEANLMKLEINQHSLDDLNPSMVYEKFMLMDDPQTIDRAEKLVSDDLHKSYTILRSDPHFLEFINKKADKGTAVAELAKQLKIPLDQVMGIGDGGNDLHLIETSGIGVAMENAILALKEIADYVTDTNDQAGVAKAIHKFVLKK